MLFVFQKLCSRHQKLCFLCFFIIVAKNMYKIGQNMYKIGQNFNFMIFDLENHSYTSNFIGSIEIWGFRFTLIVFILFLISSDDRCTVSPTCLVHNSSIQNRCRKIIFQLGFKNWHIYLLFIREKVFPAAIMYFELSETKATTRIIGISGMVKAFITAWDNFSITIRNDFCEPQEIWEHLGLLGFLGHYCYILQFANFLCFANVFFTYFCQVLSI